MSLFAAQRQIAYTTLLAGLVPLLIMLVFARLAQLPEPFATLTDFGAPTLAVGLLSLGALALLAGWRFGRIGEVFAAAPALQLQELRRRARGYLLELTAGVVLQQVLVVLAVVADTRGAPGLTSLHIALLATLVLLAVALIAVPILVEAMRLMGHCFGALVRDEGVLPSLMRNLPAVIMGALAALVLPVYQLSRYGELTADVVFVTACLLVYVAVVTALNLRYTLDSLVPVNTFLESASPLGVDASVMQPRSLDVVGVVIGRMQRLLEQVGRVQREHDEGEVRLRQFAEAASDWFFEIDADLRFSWISPKFEEIFGAPVSTIVGRSTRETSAAYIAEGSAAYQRALEAQRPYRNYRFDVRVGPDELRHVQVSGIPWFDADGTFRGYRGVGTDVTERVRAERRLLEQESQLAQAQKMEAVGQLTGGIAHDFNNLLTAVLGHLELAQLRRDPAEGPVHVEAALDAARRGADLVQRLLTFSRRQELRPKVIDPLVLLRGMEELLRRTLGETVELRVSGAPEAALCLADPAQLESALLNLAINARDAMPGGGVLSLHIERCQQRQPTLSVAPGDYVSIAVLDEGCGIAAEQLPHVFEPFYTTKPSGVGSGLGLSMVYGFVRQSGGAVQIDSRVGEGTRVTMYLPLAEADSMTEEIPPDATPASAPAGTTILVVEDDPAVRTVVTGALQDAGYQVIAVEDGAAALVQLEDLPEIALVLTDVVLPGGYNGLDVIDGMRALRPDVKFLMMSGYARDELEAGGEWTRSIPLLGKPFRIGDLQREVARVLGTRQDLDGPQATRAAAESGWS